MQLLGKSNMIFRLLCAAIVLVACGWIATSASANGSAPPAPRLSPERLWIEQIEPLLDRKCLKCHAGVRQQGGLDLRSLETIVRGGDSGPEIVPGNPAASRIVTYTSPASGPHMPPDPAKRLTPVELSSLKQWIAALPAVKTAQVDPRDRSWLPSFLDTYKRATVSTEKAPASLSASKTIDWYLAADGAKQKLALAGNASDAVIVRRLYLDLAGRIPTRAEAIRFLSDAHPDRRARLVDQLLASNEYAVRMREIFDTALMGRVTEQTAPARINNLWYAYLENCFKTNRPWNEMVRDILVARPQTAADAGAVWFLAERNNNYQIIAEAVAPVVYGVQIKCAQCHNHPLAWEIEQRHYWGLVAVFNRSANVNTNAGMRIGESAIGGFINFANLKKESQPASLVFLNGRSVAEKRPGTDEKQVDSADLYQTPPSAAGKATVAAVPRFSRREQFAASATSDNPMLARAFVNRIWAAFMGRGFTQPIDQVDSKHRAVHPELFNYLTEDFQLHGYDIKRLIRSIVLSDAYQRDSAPAAKTAPPNESFARALDRPMTAEQLYRSLAVACDLKSPLPTSSERAFITTFPDVMPDTYAPSLQQALLLTNSTIVDEMLKPANSAAISDLQKVTSTGAAVKEAFLRTLGRSPDAAETKQAVQIVRSSSRDSGLRNLLWALITCSEFRLNH